MVGSLAVMLCRPTPVSGTMDVKLLMMMRRCDKGGLSV